ncbi:uncharacterized methyltransferase C25B8.09 [Aplysia californica]|uniref:Uncharacterized methyltransferase C25B8.09 n=1 Tax=Aplysia californica TaxID=6500 RepID=A0ABM0JAK7_APLCA|nr:uncharacterized methyltransferase C25B8.09 [Aplysia californica]
MDKMHCSTKADGEPDGAYIAAVGFKTGADNYEKGRPSYTAEAVDYVVSEVAAVAKSRPESTGTTKYNVVELGAGTGKLTEVLCKKLPESCRYLALEPSQEFHDTMAAKNLGVDTVVGDAGAIPVEDGSAENVVCAQSFHWFADKEYLEEIRRVLVPGGRLMIVMNWKLFERDWMKPIYEQRKKVYARTGSSLKFLINSKQWQRDIKDSPLFSFKEHLSLPGIEFRGDVEKILQNLTTTSAYNMLPKEEQEAYLNELRQILRSWPGLDLNDLSIPFSSEIYTYIAQ